ncbi:hypothetical protein D3C80_778940 [compost metagenome]
MVKPTHFVKPALIAAGAKEYALCIKLEEDGDLTAWGDTDSNLLFYTREGDGSRIEELLGVVMVIASDANEFGRGHTLDSAIENLYKPGKRCSYKHARIKSSTKWLYTVSPNFGQRAATSMKMARLCKLTGF